MALRRRLYTLTESAQVSTRDEQAALVMEIADINLCYAVATTNCRYGSCCYIMSCNQLPCTAYIFCPSCMDEPLPHGCRGAAHNFHHDGAAGKLSCLLLSMPPVVPAPFLTRPCISFALRGVLLFGALTASLFLFILLITVA
jgi:hypothetical protein